MFSLGISYWLLRCEEFYFLQTYQIIFQLIFFSNTVNGDAAPGQAGNPSDYERLDQNNGGGYGGIYGGGKGAGNPPQYQPPSQPFP